MPTIKKRKKKLNESWKIAITTGYLLIAGSALFFFINSRIEPPQEPITYERSMPSLLDTNTLADRIAITVTGADKKGSILENPPKLQTYVSALSAEYKRDVVITDTNQVILADTLVQNRGTEFVEDKEDEVGQTLQDGITRTFIEQGIDYPDGIVQTVVVLSDERGKIVGALILSKPIL